jgi:hypothetical protein
MTEDNAHAWAIAAVIVAPAVIWWAWEMVRAIRERWRGCVDAEHRSAMTWATEAPSEEGDGTP